MRDYVPSQEVKSAGIELTPKENNAIATTRTMHKLHSKRYIVKALKSKLDLAFRHLVNEPSNCGRV